MLILENLKIIVDLFSVSAHVNNETAVTVFSLSSSPEWVAPGTQVGYIQIKLPFAIEIWRFALRGKNSGTDKWFSWVFEGSNDGEIYTILYRTIYDELGNVTKFYTLASPGPKCLYYRFYGVKAESTNPGLSYMQIYSVDDLI